MPEQLDVTPIPVELGHVWDWWQALNKTRPVGMDIGAITYSEIKSWRDLYGYEISRFELDCLMTIESVFMRVRREQMARKQPTASE
jgi:hypothetical protein